MLARLTHYGKWRANRPTSRRLASMSDRALTVLDLIMNDDSVAAGIRARTAERVLSDALRYSETVDLHAKLERVESKLGGTDATITKEDM